MPKSSALEGRLCAKYRSHGSTIDVIPTGTAPASDGDGDGGREKTGWTIFVRGPSEGFDSGGSSVPSSHCPDDEPPSNSERFATAAAAAAVLPRRFEEHGAASSRRRLVRQRLVRSPERIQRCRALEQVDARHLDGRRRSRGDVVRHFRSNSACRVRVRL